MKILLAVDGSSCSDNAVAEVCRRPWPSESEVRILAVHSPWREELSLGRSSTAFDAINKQLQSEAAGNLQHAVAAFQRDSPGVHVTPVLREGWPKDVILDEAERWGADLIVLRSHGHGAIKRLVLGSVSLAVATNAPCSVEIVRRSASLSS